MNPDDIINTYKEKLGEPPSLETVERERGETLKKVSRAQVLARLKDRIVAAYQILLDNIRTAYDMISDSVTGKYKGVPKSTLAFLAGGLAYLALPIDLVPDFIPAAGWMDDAAVLAWIFKRCADEFQTYKGSNSRTLR